MFVEHGSIYHALQVQAYNQHILKFYQVNVSGATWAIHCIYDAYGYLACFHQLIIAIYKRHPLLFLCKTLQTGVDRPNDRGVSRRQFILLMYGHK